MLVLVLWGLQEIQLWCTQVEDADSVLTAHHWSKKLKGIRSLVKDREDFAVLADAEAAPPLLKEALRADHFPTVGDTGMLLLRAVMRHEHAAFVCPYV